MEQLLCIMHNAFFEGVFEKRRFLNILQSFICFNVDGANTFKVLAGYHQYFAVKKAIESTQQAESRQNFLELLAGRQANGIIFTTMQKFEETGEMLSERRNIVVMADEANRGQYGLTEKAITKRNEKGGLEVRISIHLRFWWMISSITTRITEPICSPVKP